MLYMLLSMAVGAGFADGHSIHWRLIGPGGGGWYHGAVRR